MHQHRMGEPRVLPAKAINAPPPGQNEVRRTALPDTFDGIRFETVIRRHELDELIANLELVASKLDGAPSPIVDAIIEAPEAIG